MTFEKLELKNTIKNIIGSNVTVFNGHPKYLTKDIIKHDKNNKVDYLEYEKTIKEKDKFKNKFYGQRKSLKEAEIEHIDELKEIVDF